MSSRADSKLDSIPEGSSERAPLLETETQTETVLIVDPDATQGRVDPSMLEVDKKQRGWGLFWKIAIGLLALICVFLAVKGFVEGGDTGFDWRGTFKKALGGGLSGAAGILL